MAWTTEANNGPPGDDEEERENRPTAWNIGYFDFLGVLCVMLPFDQARTFVNRANNAPSRRRFQRRGGILPPWL